MFLRKVDTTTVDAHMRQESPACTMRPFDLDPPVAKPATHSLAMAYAIQERPHALSPGGASRMILRNSIYVFNSSRRQPKARLRDLASKSPKSGW